MDLMDLKALRDQITVDFVEKGLICDRKVAIGENSAYLCKICMELPYSLTKKMIIEKTGRSANKVWPD